MTQDHSRPDEQTENASNIATALGEQLAVVREASGRSMTNIGQQLCINTSTIRYLESGQWESAGPDVYVRGYLMAYCRLLELDATEVVLHFKQREANRVADSSSDIARQQRRPEFARYQRAAGYAAATLLIGPALIFWVAQGFRGVEPQPGTEVMSQLAPDAGFVVQELQESTIDAPQDANQQPVMASMATVPEVLPRTVAGSATVQHVSLLLLDFKEEVWLEVSDGSGKRLDYGLVPASSQRSFSIAQGLSIRLGNADSVVAKIDGEVLDLLPFIDQDVASFNLPLTQVELLESDIR